MCRQYSNLGFQWNTTIILILACLLLLSPQWTCSVFAEQSDAEILLAQATLAYENHLYEKALSLLLEAKDHDPNNSRVLYYLGLVYLAQKQPAEAARYLEQGLEIRPENFFLQYQLGVAYFALKKYDQAAPLLFAVYKEQPMLDSLGFYVGYLRYRQKDYDGALEAFEANNTDDVDTQQLTQFYRGMTLGILGLPQQAIEELEEIKLERAVTPLASAAIRIRERLAAERKVDEKKPWQLQLSVGGFYDDNVAINPDPVNRIPILQPPIDPNLVINNLRRRQTTAPGFLASLRADYAFLRKGPFELTGTYSFFQTVNGEDLDELNIQDHLGGLSGFYRGVVADIPYQVDLQYTYDYLFLDMTGFLARHTPTFSATILPPTFTLPGIGAVGNLTTALYRYRKQTFFNEEAASNDIRFGGGVLNADNFRDGYNNMLGVLHAFRFDSDRLILRIGYQYDNESTEGGPFSYQGDRLLTGGQLKIPWGGMTLRYDYDVHWRDYKNKQTFPFFTDRDGKLVRRHDIQQTHLVQLTKPLPNNFVITAQYQGIRNESRIPVYDYSKNVWTLIVTWTY